MQKILMRLGKINLVGITARTNNALEMDQASGRVGPTLNKYHSENLSERIKHRKEPGATFGVYINYESDHTGNYTYFVGEEVRL
jgi:predicted transcriptional regulator YdeE